MSNQVNSQDTLVGRLDTVRRLHHYLGNEDHSTIGLLITLASQMAAKIEELEKRILDIEDYEMSPHEAMLIAEKAKGFS